MEVPEGTGKDRIIVALDVPNLERAGELVEMLAGCTGPAKLGLELTCSVGMPQAIDFVHGKKGRVFLDGKLCDISNTVKGAATAIAKKDVWLLNVHASAGVAAMRAAVEATEAVAKEKGTTRTLVAAVSVLTSLSTEESELIFGASSKAKVLQFARDAITAGVDALICSPQELAFLKGYPETHRLGKIIPGIRPAGAAVGDQKRPMTPYEAIMAGATYVVIGRPITKPDTGTPVEAANAIAEEIDRALAELTAAA